MFQQRKVSACAFVLSIGILLAAIGCGQNGANRGVVSGEVKLDGQLLATGSISFTPIEGTKGTMTGAEIKDGRYQISGDKGPAVGWNRVEVRAMRKSGKKVPKPFAPPGEMVDEMVSAVAPQFSSASTLKVEIKPGDNTANFEIKSK